MNQEKIPDNNLPIYLQKYTVEIFSSKENETKYGSIVYSTVGAIPSNQEEKRVWQLNLTGYLKPNVNKYHIVYDFKDVDYNEKNIIFENIVSGTFNICSQVFDASKIIGRNYTFSDKDSTLTIIIDMVKLGFQLKKESLFSYDINLNGKNTSPCITLSKLMDKYIPEFVDIMKDMPKGSNPDTPYNNSFTLANVPNLFYVMEFGFGSIVEPYVEICNQIAVELTSESTIDCRLVSAGCGDDKSQCDYVKTVEKQLKDAMKSFINEVKDKFPKYTGINLFVYNNDEFLEGNLTIDDLQDFTVRKENGRVVCSEKDKPPPPPQSNNIKRRRISNL